MKKGIFLTLLFCGVAVADMSRSGEIVTDSKTKLMWQDNNDAKTVTKNWQGAIDYCEALNFGGYTDWRLPNTRELRSIVDYSRSNPAMNPAFVNVTIHYDYGSSTSLSGKTDYAWDVSFYEGHVSGGYKYDSLYVRCVRGGR